jgi:hypothetical protein
MKGKLLSFPFAFLPILSSSSPADCIVGNDAARLAGPGLHGDPPQGQGLVGRNGDLTRPSFKRIRRPRGGFFYILQTKVRGNNSFGRYLMNQGINLKVFIGHYL